MGTAAAACGGSAADAQPRRQPADHGSGRSGCKRNLCTCSRNSSTRVGAAEGTISDTRTAAGRTRAVMDGSRPRGT